MYRIKESISKTQVKKLYEIATNKSVEIATNKPIQTRIKTKQHYSLDILIGKLMWAIFFNKRRETC